MNQTATTSSISNCSSNNQGVRSGSGSTACGNTSACTAGSSVPNSKLSLPDVDVLSWTKELPELAGFSRFLAATLGCYDDAKSHLDELMLQHTLELLGRMPARGQSRWPLLKCHLHCIPIAASLLLAADLCRVLQVQ
jgi:hypothetical protein